MEWWAVLHGRHMLSNAYAWKGLSTLFSILQGYRLLHLQMVTWRVGMYTHVNDMFWWRTLCSVDRLDYALGNPVAGKHPVDRGVTRW